MDIKYRDWGEGIPEYTPEDVLSMDEIQRLCVTYAGSMYAEGGYDVDSVIYDRGRYPNLAAKKDGKMYCIAVMGEQWPIIGHMSVLHMRDYYESCAEHGGIACIAAVSLKSNDGESQSRPDAERRQAAGCYMQCAPDIRRRLYSTAHRH